jgi:glutaredoxin-like protein NrdH
MSYKDSAQSVPGQKDKGLFLYTLSTCIWCRRTKAMLKDLGLAYDFVDVDLLEGADKEEMMKDFVKYNPNTSFPTILVDGGKSVILGFDEDKINGLV